MKKIETGIEGLVVLEPKVHGDERGFFLESFNARTFTELGLPTLFKQDNHSRSARGVLRGMHFQDPNGQGKLVRAIAGTVWDVVVDVRRGSPTYGQHYAVELSAENKRMMYVPPGFAHGFCVLSEAADFEYKCTEIYSPKDEKGFRWDDPDLRIPWPIQNPTLSERDLKWGRFRDYHPS